MDADEIREAIAQKQALVSIHKRNLFELEKQKAACGLFVLPMIFNGIEHEREQIELLEREITELKDTLSVLQTDLKHRFADIINRRDEANKEPYLLYGSYRKFIQVRPIYDIDILCILHESSS